MKVAYQIPKLGLKDGRLLLRCPYEDRELAKAVAGAKWDPMAKGWSYVTRPEVLADLKRLFPALMIDPEASEAVRRVSEQEATAQAVKEITDDEDLDVELPVRIKPFLHQKKAFKIGITLPSVALLMEMGTGKTLTSIAIAGHRWKYDGLRRVLVVAPLSVVPVWPREFSKYAAFPVDCRALKGTSAEKMAELAAFPPPSDALQVAVVNYESTWRIESALKRWLQGAGQGGAMIIADESQRIKTPGAAQSKAMHRLGALAAYRLILTGTPVTNSPVDFFSQYKFLDPTIFGTSFTAFKARYCDMMAFEGQNGAFKKIIGYRNLDELVRKAHSIAFRVTKAEALDLPEEIIQQRLVELEPKTMRLYSELRREAIAELENGVVTAQNVLTKLLRLSQLTGGFLTDETGRTHSVGDEKMRAFEETLDDLLDAGKKVVVFARFIPEIRTICTALEKRGIQYRYITGEVDQSARGEAVQAFQTDPEVRVFVAQIQTAGLGITLTAADTAIFYSMDFSLANYEQAKARIHRVGQRNTVTHIHLIAAGTVDEKIFEALREKKNLADLVVDRWRELLK